MSPKSLLETEWFDLHDQLSTVFTSFVPNPAARAAIYYTELNRFKAETVAKAVKTIIKTHHKFPSIADMLEIINQLDPPPDPVIQAARQEELEWRRAESERRRVFTAINNLPDFERQALIDESDELCANELRANNVPQWMPFKILRDARLLMLYRERYEA